MSRSASSSAANPFAGVRKQPALSAAASPGPQDLTQAANAPGQATGSAAGTAGAAKDPDPAATEADSEPAASAPAATSAPAAAVETTATTEATATMAAAATMATATATASAGKLDAAAADVFPIEQVERGEADVGHFLFAENEAMIGQAIVGCWDVAGRRRRCGCATHQRKTQSGGTQHSSFARTLLRRSLLDPWHGRILISKERARPSQRAPGERGAQELPGPKMQNIS